MSRAHYSLALLLVLLLSGTGQANSSGQFGFARLNNCSNCHGAEQLTTIACVDGLPADGRYTPGQSYPLVLSVDRVLFPQNPGPPANQAGFSLEIGTTDDPVSCTAGPTGSSPGTLAGDSVTTQVDHTSPCARATHTSPGAKQISWNLTWTAPATSHPIYFFLAGNAVNGNNSPNGDAPIHLLLPVQLEPGTPLSPLTAKFCTPLPVPVPVH